jgi:hypothetical protein
MKNFPTKSSVIRRLKKFAKYLEKVAKKAAEPKECPSVYIKAQFEISKHLHQTTFEI